MSYSIADEKLLQHESDAISIHVLLNPRCVTVCSRLKSVLLSGVQYLHVIYSGYAVSDSVDWILQDDIFTAASFVSPFKFSDVDEALKTHPNTTLVVSTLDIASKLSEWTEVHLNKHSLNHVLKIKVNPDVENEYGGAVEFAQFLGNLIENTEVKQLLPSTDVVGNIRFNRPTIYIFPCGQGDSTFFGISGFNLLINGGYNRQAAFWNFVRHVDRIDGLLVTHLDSDNLWGLSSFLEKKLEGGTHPEVGVVYVNTPDKSHKQVATPDAEANHQKESSLFVSIPDASNQFVDHLHQINRHPLQCVSKVTNQHTIEPLNLYHKVGHGSLDLYVVNPIADSKDLKELYTQWSKGASHFTTVKLPQKGGVKDVSVSLPRLVSVSVVIVWRPAGHDEAITRVLLPGDTPQSRLFEGLDHLKSMDIFQHAACSQQILTAAKVVKKPTPSPAPSAASASVAPKSAPPTPAKSVAAPKSAPPGTPSASKSSAQPASTPASSQAKSTPHPTPSSAGPAKSAATKTSAAAKSAPVASKKEDKPSVDKSASIASKKEDKASVDKSASGVSKKEDKPSVAKSSAPVASKKDDKPSTDKKAPASTSADRKPASASSHTTPPLSARAASPAKSTTKDKDVHKNVATKTATKSASSGKTASPAPAAEKKQVEKVASPSSENVNDPAIDASNESKNDTSNAVHPDSLPGEPGDNLIESPTVEVNEPVITGDDNLIESPTIEVKDPIITGDEVKEPAAGDASEENVAILDTESGITESDKINSSEPDNASDVNLPAEDHVQPSSAPVDESLINDEEPQQLPAALSRSEMADLGIYDEQDSREIETVPDETVPDGLPLPEYHSSLTQLCAGLGGVEDDFKMPSEADSIEWSRDTRGLSEERPVESNYYKESDPVESNYYKESDPVVSNDNIESDRVESNDNIESDRVESKLELPAVETAIEVNHEEKEINEQQVFAMTECSQNTQPECYYLQTQPHNDYVETDPFSDRTNVEFEGALEHVEHRLVNENQTDVLNTVCEIANSNVYNLSENHHVEPAAEDLGSTKPLHEDSHAIELTMEDPYVSESLHEDQHAVDVVPDNQAIVEPVYSDLEDRSIVEPVNRVNDLVYDHVVKPVLEDRCAVDPAAADINELTFAGHHLNYPESEKHYCESPVLDDHSQVILSEVQQAASEAFPMTTNLLPEVAELPALPTSQDNSNVLPESQTISSLPDLLPAEILSMSGAQSENQLDLTHAKPDLTDVELNGMEDFDPLSNWGHPSGLPAPANDKTADKKKTASKPPVKKFDLNQSLPARVGAPSDKDNGTEPEDSTASNGVEKKAASTRTSNMAPPAAAPRKPRASAAASTKADSNSKLASSIGKDCDIISIYY